MYEVIRAHLAAIHALLGKWSIAAEFGQRAVNTQGIHSCLEHEFNHPGSWASHIRTMLLITSFQSFLSKYSFTEDKE